MRRGLDPTRSSPRPQGGAFCRVRGARGSVKDRSVEIGTVTIGSLPAVMRNAPCALADQRKAAYRSRGRRCFARLNRDWIGRVRHGHKR